MIRMIALAALLVGCISKPDAPGPQGVDRRWTQRDDGAAQAKPAPSVQARLVWDGGRHRMILLDEADATWVLDPDTGWQKLCSDCISSLDPAGKSRTGAAVGYDPKNDRVLLFGGSTDNGEYSADMFELRDDHWVAVMSSGEVPEARASASMTYDPESGMLWLIGGYYNGNPAQDAYTLDGRTWKRSNTPADVDFVVESQGITATYDRENARVLVYGDGNAEFDILWQHTMRDGWSRLCTGCLDVGRMRPSIVHLPEYDQTFLVGGCEPGQTQSCYEPGAQKGGTLILVGDHFVPYAHDPMPPPPRNSPALAYDPDRDVVVSFGGYRFKDDGDPDCNGVGSCGGTWELARD